MMESLRCCIACIFPCGALDVIRVVHSSGRVEELGGRVLAGELMRSYPRHVVRRPSTSAYDDDCESSSAATTSMILPPDAELKRGRIYLLVPTSAVEKPPSAAEEETANSTRRRRRRKKKEAGEKGNDKMRLLRNGERCLSEIRRGSRVGVWRPHLESISENDF